MSALTTPSIRTKTQAPGPVNFFHLAAMKRELTWFEETVIRLCQEKHGSSERDEGFLLEPGEAVFQSWGNHGDGPWVHLTDLASWLEEGLSGTQTQETQAQAQCEKLPA